MTKKIVVLRSPSSLDPNCLFPSVRMFLPHFTVRWSVVIFSRPSSAVNRVQQFVNYTKTAKGHSLESYERLTFRNQHTTINNITFFFSFLNLMTPNFYFSRKKCNLTKIKNTMLREKRVEWGEFRHIAWWDVLKGSQLRIVREELSYRTQQEKYLFDIKK